mmetsp:Transcript_45002/g.105188  ORF Transcript_45002/g.105188 Transcript_45002/m.105188 type:complete len:505 (-) Transcript_45002:1833-3347(-)
MLQSHLLASWVVYFHRCLRRPAQLALHQRDFFWKGRFGNQGQVVPELAYHLVEEDSSTFRSCWEQRAKDQLVGRCLFRGQDELCLTKEAIAVQGHLEDHNIIKRIHQLDVNSHCLSHHTCQSKLLLRLRRQRHELDSVPREVPSVSVSEHDAACDLARLQWLEDQLVLPRATAIHLNRRGARDMHEITLDLEGGGHVGVILHREDMRGLLPRLALHHHMLLCQRLFCDTMQVVLVGLVGTHVVQHQLRLYIADPLRLEGERIGRHGGLPGRSLLLGEELPGPVKFVSDLRKSRLDGPFSVRWVHDWNLLRDRLPSLRGEGQGAVRVGRCAGPLELVDADIYIRCQGHRARVHAGLLGPELHHQLGHLAGLRRGSAAVTALGSICRWSAAFALAFATGSIAVVDAHLLRSIVVRRRDLHVVVDVVRRIRRSSASVLQPGASTLDLHVSQRQDDVLRPRCLCLHLHLIGFQWQGWRGGAHQLVVVLPGLRVEHPQQSREVRRCLKG